MADKSKIEWTDATWNPVIGCTKVSPGCDHCYAIRTAHRMQANPNPKIAAAYAGTEEGGEWTGQVNLLGDRLDQPLRWRDPRRIFVNAQSDLFHDQVTDEFIAEVFAVMALANQHTFQILTKRHGRMRSLLRSAEFQAMVDHNVIYASPDEGVPSYPWPLPNVWLGVSVENQHWADIRIRALLGTPAAIRFLSCEPLLGPVDLTKAIEPNFAASGWKDLSGLHWVIVGGESGPAARPMHPTWARELRDQCVAAGIPFHFKQRGEWTWNEPDEFRVPTAPFSDRVAVMHGAGMTAMTKSNPFNPFERGHPFWTTRIERVGKARAGRLLDGRTWDEYPQAVPA